MTKNLSKLIGLPLLAAGFAVSVGCASTGDLKEVRAMAEEAQQTANEAKAMAADAEATAEEANQRSMQTDQKIDEMFKKSMAK